ncbi:type IV secretion protein Rhs [Anopheles sinensis]|uniref:Type IV secretion protein Rhs n=1 Tax=Anopheles sinensis TaxID=74873 RepID=A0A084VQB3_ANOSI|nr:type IV secretion protein Rhs [Anopheles sinensis]
MCADEPPSLRVRHLSWGVPENVCPGFGVGGCTGNLHPDLISLASARNWKPGLNGKTDGKE